MICPNCSNVILDESVFCGFCGHAMAPAAPEAVQETAAPVVTAPVIDAVPEIPVVETPVAETVPAPVEIAAEEVPPGPVFEPAPAIPFDAPKQDKHIGAWRYFFTDIVLCIPLLGLIMFFVWACSSKANKQRKSYVRSKFIWFIVSLILSIAAGVLCFYFWSYLAPVIKSIALYWAYYLDLFAKSLV